MWTTGPLSPVPMTPRGVPLTGTHAGVLSSHGSLSVVDHNINEDDSSRQSTCSLLDFFPRIFIFRVRRTYNNNNNNCLKSNIQCT